MRRSSGNHRQTVSAPSALTRISERPVRVISGNGQCHCQRLLTSHEPTNFAGTEWVTSTLPPNAGVAPQRSAADPQGISALCWRRHGLDIGRRVRGPCAGKDVPPVSWLRMAVSAAREARRAPRFRALGWRKRRSLASLAALCSSRRRTLSSCPYRPETVEDGVRQLALLLFGFLSL
jgi:hypothetical protein